MNPDAGLATPPERAGEAPLPATSETASAASAAGPIGAAERLPLLDVLRGFAVGGVFMSNLFIWHSGRFLMSPERMKEMMADPVNIAFGLTFGVLVFGRFVSMFTFLFGFGFAVQTGRAEERGAPAGRLYARRLLFLLLIGAAHLTMLWYGDILHLYAVLGLSLLAFRRLSARALIGWGLALMFAGYLLAEVAIQLGPRLWTAPEALGAQAEAEQAREEAWRAATLASFSSDSYLTLIRTNLTTHLHLFLKPQLLSFYVSTVGKFMLGAGVARSGLLHDVPRHRRALRRLLAGGVVLGVLGSGAGVAFGVLFRKGMLPKESALLEIAGHLLRELGAVGIAAIYVAAIALLFQRPRLRRALSLLAPAGRMALTNYLMQSVFAVLIFCGVGLGLIGKLGPAPCFAIVAVLFSLQILASHLWLARFRFGPAEWVWRSLTYGQAQPMRREPAPQG